MTTKINTKTVAPATTVAPGSLLDMLTQAVAAQASGFRQVEIARRTQAKEVVGADADLLTLQTMEGEAESLGLPAEFLATFKAKAKHGRELLIEAEAAGQMARRLAAASTVGGLQAQIERAKAANAAKAEQEKRAKAKEAAQKAQEAREARIASIVAQLGELTPNQAHSVTCFLRENSDWTFHSNAKGIEALKNAAFKVAAERKAFLKAEAKGKAAAAAAAAPLTHKMVKK